jgi:hypothetical protein
MVFTEPQFTSVKVLSYQGRGALQFAEYPSNFILISQNNGQSLWSMAPHDSSQAADITTMHGAITVVVGLDIHLWS